jgi:hypothetical protein
MQMQQ